MSPHRAANFPSTGNPNGSGQQPAVQMKRFFIRFAIAATAATFVAMVGMLYYSWWRRPAGTTALIVVVGDEGFEGTRVRVEGVSPPAVERVLSKENAYACRIPVVSGTFTIDIEQSGRTLMHQDLVRIREHDLAHVDLRKIATALSGSAERTNNSSRNEGR